MAEISATFSNAYGESRQWWIWDLARDPNAPPLVFNGYLGKDESTQALALYSDDGVYSRAAYQRSDGAQTIQDSITNNDTIRME